MGMVIAVLTVLVVCVALIVAKIVPVLAGVVLMVIGLIAVVAMAERRDRTRQRGIHDASQRLDAEAFNDSGQPRVGARGPARHLR